MRRSLPLLVLVGAVLAIAGCGSASSSSSGTGARDAELSYFPSASPFVLSVATDPNASAVKQGQALLGRFPIAAFGQALLTTELQRLGIDYQSDIRPLFGNPVMVGASGARLSGAARHAFLLAWVTKDAGKLRALVKKLPGIHSVGSHDGATLYQNTGSTTLALDGATAVLSPSQGAVSSALDRHAHGGGISGSDYVRAFSGLPQDALIEVFGSLSGVLSSPSAAAARRLPWVAALRWYAASISASGSGLTLQYRLDTGGGALTSVQVPVTPGTTAPSLAGTLPITVAIKDPAHLAAFGETAEQAVSPSSYASFQQRQAAVKAKTGVDLNSLLELLTGELIIASDIHTTMARGTVSDPAAAAADLSRLLSAPRSLFSKATGVSKLGGGFYAIKEKRDTITVGVEGNQLIVGNAGAVQLRAFAAAPTAPVAGAHGSVVFRVALSKLLALAIKRTPPQIVAQLLSSLGDVTGSMSASTKALTGNATLAIK